MRLTGRRIDGRGAAARGDSFTKDERIEGVMPGTGPVSIATWVYGLNKGDWEVDAKLFRAVGERHAARQAAGSPGEVRRATWSWRRWAVSSAPADPIETRWAPLAPLARQPAVIPGLYFGLAIIGILMALALQAVIVGRAGMEVGPPLAASAIATLAGLIGAKAWYAVLHPEESVIRGGWAVDGFLVVAPLVAALTLFAWAQPIGRLLDANAPGIFFAVALGRVGCFLTGCCAGRCTASRWGIWSSDRRVGARRIPTQLLEAGTGLVLGLLSLFVTLAGGLPIPGAVFLGTFAAYAAIRQALLRLRAERRRDLRTLPVTAAAAVLVTVIVAVLSLVQSK